MRILITGAAGAGTTTLGNAVASKIAFREKVQNTQARRRLTNGSIILFPFFWQQFMLHVLICRLFTAHSLRSLETLRMRGQKGKNNIPSGDFRY
jgi:hypothetical protein